MTKPDRYDNRPRAPIPRPPVFRWWHYPQHWLGLLGQGQSRADAAPKRPKWIGALVLAFGLIVSVLCFMFILVSLQALEWPSWMALGGLVLGVVLTGVGWLLLKTIESRLWTCFFAFMTAILGDFALPGGSFAFVASLAGANLSIASGQGTEPSALWVLLAGAALTLVAVLVVRRG